MVIWWFTLRDKHFWGISTVTRMRNLSLWGFPLIDQRNFLPPYKCGCRRISLSKCERMALEIIVRLGPYCVHWGPARTSNIYGRLRSISPALPNLEVEVGNAVLFVLYSAEQNNIFSSSHLDQIVVSIRASFLGLHFVMRLNWTRYKTMPSCQMSVWRRAIQIMICAFYPQA